MGLTFSNLNCQKNSAVQPPETEAANLRALQQLALGEPNPDAVPPRPSQAAAAASASLPVQGSMRGLSAQLELVNLPQSLLDQIASHLPDRDIPAVALTHRDLGRATKARQTSLQVAHDVLQVSTLAELQGSIKAISALRSELQTEPLRQVMLRIHALPLQDRPQALTELRQAVRQLDLQDRPQEPPRLENILSHADAVTAFLHGENDVVVARVFGITAPVDIDDLEGEVPTINAHTTAADAMRAGGNVQEVAAQFGITTQEGIRQLEIQTTVYQGPNTARTAVEASGNVQTVAQQFGIITPSGVRDLEMWATVNAMAALRTGGNVQEVADRFGITTRQGMQELHWRADNLSFNNNAEPFDD